MNDTLGHASRQHTARVAGIAYVVTILAGLFAEAYARGSLLIANDPTRTAANLLDAEVLYRSGILADCLMLGAYLVVTAMLYRLFKPVHAGVSLVAAFFSLLGLALLVAATGMLKLPPLQPGYAYDVLRLHGAIYNMTDLFFGPYCLLIGWLAVRSDMLPKPIGWLMELAGVVFLVEAIAGFVAPVFSRQLPDALPLVTLVGESAIALWLAIFGIRRENAHA
ncbi:MAG: DUF4386 domain-containing protein [Luteimonas sp.]